jgi:putative exosortase-associated protein (TIGR04073 family)
MLKHKHLFLISVLAINAYAPASQAEGYAADVSHKFTRGVSNLFTGLGEVPKNIVNTTNKTNPVVGGVGGLLLGTLDTLGRTATGVFDVVTSPFPTKSLVQPEYVWTDFNKSTSYSYSQK